MTFGVGSSLFERKSAGLGGLWAKFCAGIDLMSSQSSLWVDTVITKFYGACGLEFRAQGAGLGGLWASSQRILC